ncbi:hypothetical protein BGZ76_004736 [Entomortierella beljakovae]|nr:hypothetical protein BGZ76_004736 [Entomortierella beljakovae]
MKLMHHYIQQLGLSSVAVESQKSNPQETPEFIQELYGSNSNSHSSINHHSQAMMNPTILASQDQELHPHVVPSMSQYPQQQQHNHNMQSYSNHYRRELESVGFQLKERLDEIEHTMRSNPPAELDLAYRRKRSLSVPMLYQQLEQQQSSDMSSGSVGATTAGATANTNPSTTEGRASTMQDGDCDMEANDLNDRKADPHDEIRRSQYERYLGYLEIAKRFYSNYRYYSGYSPLYYNHSFHNQNHSYHNQNNYSLRHHLHYNPFTHRKFPPYQFWAASAQRNYHMATIGIMPTTPSEIKKVFETTLEGSKAMLEMADSALLTLSEAGGRPPPGVGDRILRTSVKNGGISKSAYPSRLPIHFRHINSRTNRRSAICLNKQQGEINSSHQGSREDESKPTGSAVNGVLPLFSGLTIEEAGDQSESNSSSNKKVGVSDWKRVKAFNLDLGGSNHSSVNSGAGGVRAGGGSRYWESQRGGLANLLQSKPSQDSNASGNIDRLVEEMSKWSV